MLQLPAKIALLLVGDGENEVWVSQGELVERGGQLAFVRANDVYLPFEPEWVSRAKPVPENLRSAFGSEAEFYIRLLVGNLPEGIDAQSYWATGLRLPRESA